MTLVQFTHAATWLAIHCGALRTPAQETVSRDCMTVWDRPDVSIIKKGITVLLQGGIFGSLYYAP